ncbi:amino acid adenylation domain-containing protein [Streptomyces sp. NPDC059168]|uniref:amino acid adenylation domain-containing protein n=1 Tax=Streptomyces sp. NPDC059168 TaxID=3346753 RepID=UPI0036B9AC61
MGVPEKAEECLLDLLGEQTEKRPDDIAVVHCGDSLTYRELTDSSLDVAAYLTHLGISADTCVGVFVDPSIELMIGVWGVLHSGGAYLPLSPDYPEDRLRYMIEDSGISVVFTQEELRTKLADLITPGTRIITLDDAAEFRKTHGADHASPRLPAPGPESLAYVIYTSGSTGKPKGVMIEHRSITHQMKWLAATFDLGPARVVLQKTPMSFDAAQWEILASASGSRVVIGESGLHRDPTRIIKAVTEHGVTTLQCVPTLLKALLDNEEMDRCTSLTHIFSGGEALSRALAAQCAQVLPRCTLVNLYGPTECTINASAFVVDRAALDTERSSLPIGAPVAGTRFHILGPGQRPLGVGETGELHVSGIQLARGYLHRPELTSDRFITAPFDARAPHDRLYRTGDLARWNADGTVQFVGRADNQVKLRGFRVELDEIRLAIEAHDWVRNAAVLVRDDPHTGFQNLVACIELSPREAVLMDQGTHGTHHLSKESRLQVRAQLSGAGTRDDADLAGRPVVDLPGASATPGQRRRAFARKTYRFYDGEVPDVQDILDALARRPSPAGRRRPEDLSITELGALLRDFGPHLSQERLLPKYAYASPGALYATQLCLEVAGGAAGLRPGVYYYHPQRHQLILVGNAGDSDGAGTAGGPAGVALHFVGRRAAVEPVYKNNIQEVLEIEAGHMLGLFDEILPGYGLGLRDLPFDPGIRHRLGCAQDDHYLGSFALAPYAPPGYPDDVDVYVQIHPGSSMGLPPGLYRHRDRALERISGEVVLKRHVIAINQQVYERASFGITVVSRTAQDWRSYIDLGRTLQHLQLNTNGLGFMSSGYSSRTGHDLPAARRITTILQDTGLRAGPSYFTVGGGVSDEQLSHEGMHEDTVHMKGPTEMIKDDLAGFLPEFMLPNHIMVLDRLPHTANGKLDTRALEAHVDAALALDDRPVVLPRNRTEARLGDLWKSAMKREVVSVHDDFFACGGNSLIAVSLVNRINQEFGCSLPLQVLFEAPTVEKLALRIGAASASASSRLVPLRAEGGGHPVFCWPGLGGYTMNLRQLAARTPGLCGEDRPFYGVQARGLNKGEPPHTTLEEMAAADVRAVRRLQPTGPYTLWGYSFGARVAFEAAWQLEQAGEEVERLLLLAPGSPRVPGPESWTARASDFTDDTFRTILFSVFAGTTSGPLLAQCLKDAVDEESFTRFVVRRFRRLDAATVRRIIAVACRTYGWQPAPRRISAPVTVLRARNDEDSFLERASGPALTTPTVVQLDTDHYGVLRDPGVDELTKIIQREARTRPCRT